MDIRKAYWQLRNEARELLFWLVCSLPTSLGDWARFKVMGLFLSRLGQGTVIRQNFRVTMPERVSIGAHCNIAERAFITGGGGVTLGEYVGLGPDVKIWSVNHRFDDPDVPWLKQGHEELAVSIEDDVWVGANCFVMPGTTIGRGAIISAGTVLMKSVPPFAIVAGNPGRVIGWRKRPEGQVRPADSASGQPTESQPLESSNA